MIKDLETLSEPSKREFVRPISGLRRHLYWFWAVLVIVIVETTYWVVAHPNPADRGNFLRLNFAIPDEVQRLITFEKLRDLAGRKVPIVQVGDSSGLYGVPPDVVSAHLGGVGMVNLSVATNLGYLGYCGVAEHALDLNPDAKILVLYSTMLIAPPRGQLWNRGNKLIGDTASPMK